MDYNLNLNEQEVNQILDVLSDKPAKEVFGLMNKIQVQAINQEKSDYENKVKEENLFNLWKEERELEEKESEEISDADTIEGK